MTKEELEGYVGELLAMGLHTVAAIVAEFLPIAGSKLDQCPYADGQTGTAWMSQRKATCLGYARHRHLDRNQCSRLKPWRQSKP